MRKDWLSGQKVTLRHPRATLSIGLVVALIAILPFAFLAWRVLQTGPRDGSLTPLVRVMHQRALSAPAWASGRSSVWRDWFIAHRRIKKPGR